MILYLDTSALVKLLIDEAGSRDAVEAFSAADLVASSVITYAEACAALARNDRRRGASPERLSAEIEALDGLWRGFTRIPVAAQPAGRSALAHSLRGMDAVQLAAATALRERLRYSAPGNQVVFATFDLELLEAAEREGFSTLGGTTE